MLFRFIGDADVPKMKYATRGIQNFFFIFYAPKHRYSNDGRVWQIIGHWFVRREEAWLSIVFGRFRNW